MMSRLAALTIAAVALAAPASCGEHAEGPIALGEYQVQANEICLAAIDEVNGIVEPAIESTLASMGPEPFEPPALQQFYATLVEPTDEAGALVDGMLEALRALPDPEDRSAEYTRLWTDIETTMDQSRAHIAEAAADPDAAVALWDSDTSLFTPIDDRSRAMAVPGCALDT
jgi:hypothetical protein